MLFVVNIIGAHHHDVVVIEIDESSGE